MSTQKHGSSKKRNDIQFLRFVAITSVLGFHLRPQIVPQGYLGVDIFFVLSGYLMTMLTAFSNDRPLTKAATIRFYERRLRRLLPAYALMLALTTIAGTVLLISSEFKFLRIDTIWAMLFGTNLQNLISGGDYFELVSSYKFLLHTWSLSVEVQFYALAPFILAFIAFRDNRILWSLAIAFTSFELQACLENDAMAFGLLFARMWQFLVGTAVYYFEKERDEKGLNIDKDSQTVPNYFIVRLATITSLIFISFSPVLSTAPGYGITIRLLATCLTGAVMYLGPPDYLPQSIEVFTRVAVYIGDASYSIYLVHWPVIIFTKYIDLFDILPLYQILGIIFAISLLQYHLYEKLMIHFNSKVIFGTCGLLYLITLVSFGLKSPDVSNLVGINEKIGTECAVPKFECFYDPLLTKMIPPIPGAKEDYTCSFTGNGKATVFVAGNSFAIRQLPAIMKALKGRYKKLYFVARPNCVVFEHFNTKFEKRWHCDAVDNKTIEILEAVRPDLMVVTERLSQIAEMNAPLYPSIAEAKNDPEVIIMSDYLTSFSRFAKNIVFLEPHSLTDPRGHANPALVLAKKLAQGANLTDYYYDRKTYLGDILPGWIKLQAAISNCEKCTAIPLIENLCNGDRCPFFDPKKLLSYYCDYGHLSVHGIELLVKPMKRVFDKIKF